MNKELLLKTFRNVVAASIYILGVSLLMTNGEQLFGDVENSALGPFLILLLFSLSAAIVGSLVFGYSVYLFLDGKKKESVRAAIYSVSWLALITIVILLTYIFS